MDGRADPRRARERVSQHLPNIDKSSCTEHDGGKYIYGTSRHDSCSSRRRTQRNWIDLEPRVADVADGRPGCRLVVGDLSLTLADMSKAHGRQSRSERARERKRERVSRLTPRVQWVSSEGKVRMGNPGLLSWSLALALAVVLALVASLSP